MSFVDGLARTETTRNWVIAGADVVLPSGLASRGTVVVEEGRIVAVEEGKPARGRNRLQADGYWLLPGLIDLHSDAVEYSIQPRPGGQFPIEIALVELDKALAACGVTRVFHAVCIGGYGNREVRNPRMAQEIIEGLSRYRESLTVEHRFHARFEVTLTDAVATLEQLIEDGRVDLCSFMDHRPGKGQYSRVEDYRDYYRSVFMSEEAIDRMIEERVSSASWAGPNTERLAAVCREHGVPMAAHDADAPEQIDDFHALGMVIAEYPVHPAVAAKAREVGMGVLMGGPNILRGGSLSGNLSGIEAVRSGWCNLIGSDYAPMSLLHAIFTLQRQEACSLSEAVNMLSLNAARAVGIDGETGSIEPGKRADLVLVDPTGPVSRVMLTLVAGRTAYSLLPPGRSKAAAP